MKKIVLFAVAFFLVTIHVSAQEYFTGVGVRGGWGTGLTIKHFFQRKIALEGIVSTKWRGVYITGLYEIHKTAFDTPGLNWYYGGGAHIAFGNYYAGHPFHFENESYSIIGIDGIVGIEYNFRELPVNIGLDWKPALHIFGWTALRADEAAISIRYIF